MTLWWLQPEWKETRCSQCGDRIWPEGDPDWGLCWPCMQQKVELERQQKEIQEVESEE
jgi:hypothetical protein